jgi:hypothetical protein
VVTTTRTLPEALAQEGIADITGLWSSEQVDAWNQVLDPFFASADEDARSYVGADQLVSTGVFEELFTEPVRRLMAGIQPSALLYHCHCYEIAAGQEKSHIHQGRLQGWHRDWETLKYFTPGFPTYISIFILLSPVGDDDGAFEFQPLPPAGGLRTGGEIVRLVGPAGTAAIWNRSYFHRASPNRGTRRRRILKISFQPAGLANDRIGLNEFRRAVAHLDDPHLRALVDERRVGTTAPLPDAGDRVAARVIRPSSTNNLTSAAAAFARVQSMRHRLMSVAGAGGMAQ